MQAFTSVLIKILALYLISNAITSIGSVALFQYQMEDAPPLPLGAITGYLIIPVLAGVIIWVLSNKLSASVHKQEMSIEELELVSSGSFLIGLFLFCQSIGIVIGNYIQIDEIMWPRVIITAIGLLLILTPKVITGIYRKLKYFDTPSN